MHRELKRLAELGALWTGSARFSLHVHRSRSLVLAYHNIVPQGAEPAGDASLHLSQEQFAAHLDVLGRTHDIVPLKAALTGPVAGSSRPRVAITFDDAYQGALTVGVTELARRGLPATIFVPPGLLGGKEFWWDALTTAGAGELDAAVRARALGVLAGKGRAILEDSERSNALPRRAMPPHARSATEEELCSAAAVAGISLGSHTWSHPNLAALGAAELDDEMRRPLEWLRERFEGIVPYLTYPYGLFSSAVQEAARGAGYLAALRIDGGWVRRDALDMFAAPRLDVPSRVSLAGFRLRVAGLCS